MARAPSTPQGKVVPHEQLYAMKTFDMTADEYVALTELGYQFLSHGMFNRQSWHKKRKVHGGFAHAPIDVEFVQQDLQRMRDKA